MAQCLKKSLTVAALARLEPYQSQYLFNGVEYGPLMYKIIMRLVTNDSVATTEALWANLNNLPIYAASVNGNIDLINSYFDVNYSQILARGSTVDDPIAKLFDAYLVIPDYNFKQYIAKKQDDYHNRNLGASFTHENLMAQATAKLTFCGVNAHFQNGIAKQAIHDLSESAQKQLLHAHQRWPQAVSTALWPYTLCHTAYLGNVLPILLDGQLRLELFSSIKVGINMRFLHTFGCPVYALSNELASNKAVPRWDPRARLGLNLGLSPTHARNVHLVLSLTTGLVSPQFHLCFDDFFIKMQVWCDRCRPCFNLAATGWI